MPTSRETADPEEIESPKLVIKSGGPFPSIEVDTDHLPYDGAFEDALYAATKEWVKRKKFSGTATIWTWGTSSCNFIEHGVVWSVFVVPFGLGAGTSFLEHLHSHLSRKLNCVRFGDYVTPNEDDGWSGVCHVQDGKVFQVIDAITWSEV